MKKKLIGIIAVLLVALMVATTLVGCDGGGGGGIIGGGGGKSGELDILVSNLGFGTNWLYEIAKDYEAVTGVKVNVETTTLSSSILTQLEADAKIGDLCMFNDITMWEMWRQGYAVDLTDVWNTVPDGEELTVKQKVGSEIANAYLYDYDKYYSVPWIAEHTALCYNKTTLDTVLGAGNWELPKTTVELMKLLDRIKNAPTKAYGFVWSGTDAYWMIVYNTWMVQYTGIDKYYKLYNGYYWDDASQSYKFSQNAECMEQLVGLERAMEVCSKIITRSNGYSHEYSRNMSFINAQASWAGFAYGGDKTPSVFMPNGDWVYNESLEYIQKNNQTVGFMKTPVLSSMVETLSFYDEQGTFESLSDTKKDAYDKTLRDIIDYVDGGKTGTIPQYNGVNVTAADIARVEEARSILGTKMQAQAFIPSNTNPEDVQLAKDFLVFMASDRSVDTFASSCYGLSPFTQQISDGVELNYFMQEVLSVLQSSKSVVTEYYTALTNKGFTFTRAGAPEDYFWDGGYINTGKYAGQKKSAHTWFDTSLEYDKLQWRTICENAGKRDLLD